MAVPFMFNRPDLAKRMAEVALGIDPLGGSSGLFLAAPRRTGKSTFLTVDLLPELRRRGAVPVYADLWSDRTRDPAAIILEAVRTALRDTEGGLSRAARRSGVAKVGLGAWLSLDLASVGSPEGVTVPKALAELGKRTGRPIVLVIDEAQHALTTAAGENATFALKSARDMMNAGVEASPFGNVGLGLVMTGSNRDKLAALVRDRKQAFFGSRVTDFPLLGRDYADAYTDHINRNLKEDRALVPDEVWEAFRIVGHRPELLEAAVADHVLGTVGPKPAPSSLVGHARASREAFWADLDALWSTLTALQRAVVARRMSAGDAFRPFDAASMAAYRDAVARPVETPEVQTALEQLRAAGVVVRPDRGRLCGRRCVAAGLARGPVPGDDRRLVAGRWSAALSLSKRHVESAVGPRPSWGDPSKRRIDRAPSIQPSATRWNDSPGRGIRQKDPQDKPLRRMVRPPGQSAPECSNYPVTICGPLWRNSGRELSKLGRSSTFASMEAYV